MRKETFQAHLIKIGFLPLLYAVIMFIMSMSVFYSPPNFRLTNTSPATVCWYSIILIIDCIHLILTFALYRGHLKEQGWILGGAPMMCISILKIILYLVSFICLLANPVPDAVGAATAFIGVIVLATLLTTRFFYFKNNNLDDKINKFLKDEQYSSGINEESVLI